MKIDDHFLSPIVDVVVADELSKIFVATCLCLQQFHL
jgi:hypothetical protein